MCHSATLAYYRELHNRNSYDESGANTTDKTSWCSKYKIKRNYSTVIFYIDANVANLSPFGFLDKHPARMNSALCGNDEHKSMILYHLNY